MLEEIRSMEGLALPQNPIHIAGKEKIGKDRDDDDKENAPAFGGEGVQLKVKEAGRGGKREEAQGGQVC